MIIGRLRDRGFDNSWLLGFAGAHKEASAFMTATETWHVLRDCQFVLVPLIVKIKLLTFLNVAAGKKADVVVHLRIGLAGQVEGLDVGVAAVVDEAGFVAVDHAVEAEREELVEVGALDGLLSLLGRQGVVHIK